MNWIQGEFLHMEVAPKFPSTRYQGSKQKFIEWIWRCLEGVRFNSVLDAFGGTGAFAYRCKLAGKHVTYNDILQFNAIIGQALIVNQHVRLSSNDIDSILDLRKASDAPDFIERTFHDIYYTDDENRWLDKVSYNIRNMQDHFKKSLAYFALFQACICKRPYNLFHRKNLYARMSDVTRSFGNKKTWDTPFETHFRKFVAEANAAVFDSGTNCRALCFDAFKLTGDFDLVYIDTPYINEEGTGVDYAEFYHFLEGLANYDQWGENIDYNTRNLRLKTRKNVWADKSKIHEAFMDLFRHHAKSSLAVSYRVNGIPSIDEIVAILEMTHKNVRVFKSDSIKYVLSKSSSNEVLLVADAL